MGHGHAALNKMTGGDPAEERRLSLADVPQMTMWLWLGLFLGGCLFADTLSLGAWPLQHSLPSLPK